jgi:hypothetical protein
MEGEGKSGGSTQWTASQSCFVQTYRANLVSEGKKTSTGFKKVDLILCAKTLNDHFKINKTADQIANHLKTLKKSTQELTTSRTSVLWVGMKLNSSLPLIMNTTQIILRYNMWL